MSTSQLRSKPLVVAIDFDSTIAATLPAIARILKDPVDYPEVTDWKWVIRRWGNSEFYDALKLAHGSHDLEPMPGAIEAIKRIQEVATVYCLTANSATHLPDICDWFQRHGINMPLMCVKENDEKMKAQWDILVDDHPDRRHGETGDGRFVWVFRQAYNDGSSRKPYKASEVGQEWSDVTDFILRSV